MKFENAYMLHPYNFRWYILPTCEYLNSLPVSNRYLSFWFKKNAEITLAAMNAAFREGRRYATYFGEK